MKLLTLMRHAKSSWSVKNQHDKARKLNDRGKKNACLMAQRLYDQIGAPDLVLCSSAQRTRETAQPILSTCNLSEQKIIYTDELYLASPGEMLKQIELCDNNIKHLMVISHNPGTEMLGRMLHPRSPSMIPTGGLLHFSIEGDSFAISNSQAIKLLLHDYPKNTKFAEPS